jgi:hypothetical protein
LNIYSLGTDEDTSNEMYGIIVDAFNKDGETATFSNESDYLAIEYNGLVNNKHTIHPIISNKLVNTTGVTYSKEIQACEAILETGPLTSDDIIVTEDDDEYPNKLVISPVVRLWIGGQARQYTPDIEINFMQVEAQDTRDNQYANIEISGSTFVLTSEVHNPEWTYTFIKGNHEGDTVKRVISVESAISDVSQFEDSWGSIKLIKVITLDYKGVAYDTPVKSLTYNGMEQLETTTNSTTDSGDIEEPETDSGTKKETE